jgi:hypothetical protein
VGALWLLLAAAFPLILFTGLGSFVVSLHQLAFAADCGFDTLYAAEVLGARGLLAIIGTIFTGSLSDYIGREWVAILAYGVSILGVVFALFIPRDQTLRLLITSASTPIEPTPARLRDVRLQDFQLPRLFGIQIF